MPVQSHLSQEINKPPGQASDGRENPLSPFSARNSKAGAGRVKVLTRVRKSRVPLSLQPGGKPTKSSSWHRAAQELSAEMEFATLNQAMEGGGRVCFPCVTRRVGQESG